MKTKELKKTRDRYLKQRDKKKGNTMPAEVEVAFIEDSKPQLSFAALGSMHVHGFTFAKDVFVISPESFAHFDDVAKENGVEPPAAGDDEARVALITLTPEQLATIQRRYAPDRESIRQSITDKQRRTYISGRPTLPQEAA